MKRWMIMIFLLLVAAPPVLAGQAHYLSADQAWQKVQKGEVYILDVRTPGEFQQVRLADAHLIPIGNFVQREAEVPRDRPLLVYCAVGSRSQQVAAYLARKGFPQVYDLRGGISAWQLRGLPVQTGLP